VPNRTVAGMCDLSRSKTAWVGSAALPMHLLGGDQLEHAPGRAAHVELSCSILSEAEDRAARPQGRPVRELGGLTPGVPDTPDPALAVVAEEVETLQSGNGAAPVDVSSADRASLVVSVLKDGKGEAGLVALLATQAVNALHDVPAIVDTLPGTRTAGCHVNFLV